MHPVQNQGITQPNRVYQNTQPVRYVSPQRPALPGGSSVPRGQPQYQQMLKGSPRGSQYPFTPTKSSVKFAHAQPASHYSPQSQQNFYTVPYHPYRPAGYCNILPSMFESSPAKQGYYIPLYPTPAPQPVPPPQPVPAPPLPQPPRRPEGLESIGKLIYDRGIEPFDGKKPNPDTPTEFTIHYNPNNPEEVPKPKPPQPEPQARVKFTDTAFPPNAKSVGGNADNGEWARLTDIYPQCNLYTDGIEPTDIYQQDLGDCYYLASVSAVAEHPDRIKRLFKNTKIEEDGKYTVSLFIEGLWKDVTVDDYIPCRRVNGKLVPRFNNTKTNEAWGLIIEKAYAKIYGGYLNIDGGRAEEALTELTGAPMKSFDITDKKTTNADIIWKSVKYAEAQDYIMVAETGGFEDDKANNSEIINNTTGLGIRHAYTLLSAFEVSQEGKLLPPNAASVAGGQRFVKLRNPWGNEKEWIGNWADADKRLSPQFLQSIGYNVQKDDGVFLMDFNDFLKYFDYISCNVFTIGYANSSLRVSPPIGQPSVCTFDIAQSGLHHVSVHQRSTRARGGEDPRYDFFNLTILSLDKEGNIHPYGFKRGALQDMALGINLTPGTYLTYVSKV